MIIKASARGNPTALGRHLMNDRDNEQIEVHEVRGFVAEDVSGAMRQMEAIGKGSRSTKTLFSVSLSPPPRERVGIEVFEQAIAKIEAANGLTGQPRIVVFHEKEGRRHAHAVWSRIDTERMRVVPLPFFKQRVNEIAKSIYLEQGWKLPNGFIDKKDRSPQNYDLALYQQAKREGRDPARLNALAQEAWAISDNLASFQTALEQRGLYLARGDRRAHVVIGPHSEPRSLARMLGLKTKEVAARLGTPEGLRDIEATRDYIAKGMTPALERMLGDADRDKATRMVPLERDRLSMRAAHAEERRRMDEGLAFRWEAEARERANRMRKGLAGLMDRITGRYQQLREQNERDAFAALARDRTQRQTMIDAQLADRQELQGRILAVRNDHQRLIEELHFDRDRFAGAEPTPEKTARAAWLDASSEREARQNPAPPVDRAAWLQQEYSRAAQHHDQTIETDRGADHGYSLE